MQNAKLRILSKVFVPGPTLVVSSQSFITLQLLCGACVEIIAYLEKWEAVSVVLGFTQAMWLLWGRRSTKNGKFFYV